MSDVAYSAYLLDVQQGTDIASSPEGFRQATNPINPIRRAASRLAHFPSEVWDTSAESHIVRLLKVLLGDAGVGGLQRKMLLTRIQQAAGGVHFSDLDRFYGALFGISRRPPEQLSVDPHLSAVPISEWDEIRLSDASYRERAVRFAAAVSMGGTPAGIKALAEALTGVKFDLEESWEQTHLRLVPWSEHEGDTWDSLETKTWDELQYSNVLGSEVSRNVLTLRPYSIVTAAQRREIIKVLDRLRPQHTIITVEDDLPSESVVDLAFTPSSPSSKWEVRQQTQNIRIRGQLLYPEYPEGAMVDPPMNAWTGYTGEAWTVLDRAPRLLAYSGMSQVTMLLDPEAEITPPQVLARDQRVLSLPEYAIKAVSNLRAGRAASDGVLTTNPYGERSGVESVIVDGLPVADSISVSAVLATTEDRYWASPIRSGNNLLSEFLELRFDEPVLINNVSMMVSKAPCTIELQAWIPSIGQWVVAGTSRITAASPYVIPIESSSIDNPYRAAPDHWQKIQFRFAGMASQSWRVRLQRNDLGLPVSSAGTPLPYPLSVRDMDMGYRIWSLADVPRQVGEDVGSTRNIVGAPTRFKVYRSAPELLTDDLPTAWICEPQPIPDAVIPLYLKLNSSVAEVVNQIDLDPTHTGATVNIYSTMSPPSSFEGGDPGDSVVTPSFIGGSVHPVPFGTYQGLNFGTLPSWVDLAVNEMTQGSNGWYGREIVIEDLPSGDFRSQIGASTVGASEFLSHGRSGGVYSVDAVVNGRRLSAVFPEAPISGDFLRIVVHEPSKTLIVRRNLETSIPGVDAGPVVADVYDPLAGAPPVDLKASYRAKMAGFFPRYTTGQWASSGTDLALAVSNVQGIGRPGDWNTSRYLTFGNAGGSVTFSGTAGTANFYPEGQSSWALEGDITLLEHGSFQVGNLSGNTGGAQIRSLSSGQLEVKFVVTGNATAFTHEIPHALPLGEPVRFIAIIRLSGLTYSVELMTSVNDAPLGTVYYREGIALLTTGTMHTAGAATVITVANAQVRALRTFSNFSDVLADAPGFNLSGPWTSTAALPDKITGQVGTFVAGASPAFLSWGRAGVADRTLMAKIEAPSAGFGIDPSLRSSGYIKFSTNMLPPSGDVLIMGSKASSATASAGWGIYVNSAGAMTFLLSDGTTGWSASLGTMVVGKLYAIAFGPSPSTPLTLNIRVRDTADNATFGLTQATLTIPSARSLSSTSTFTLGATGDSNMVIPVYAWGFDSAGSAPIVGDDATSIADWLIGQPNYSAGDSWNIINDGYARDLDGTFIPVKAGQVLFAHHSVLGVRTFSAMDRSVLRFGSATYSPPYFRLIGAVDGVGGSYWQNYLGEPAPFTFIQPGDTNPWTLGTFLRFNPTYIGWNDGHADSIGFVGGMPDSWGRAEWTPIGQFSVTKGVLRFPDTACIALKLEFTNLVAEPYDSFIPITRAVRRLTAPTPPLSGRTMDAMEMAAWNQQTQFLALGGEQNWQQHYTLPTTALTAVDEATRDLLAQQVGSVLGMSAWQPGAVAPIAALAGEHTYLASYVQSITRTAFFCGARSIRVQRRDEYMPADNPVYHDTFLNTKGIDLNGTNLNIEPGQLYTPQSPVSSLLLSPMQATSKVIQSRTTVKAVQFATQQTASVQVFPDDEFRSAALSTYDFTDPNSWHMSGDAAVFWDAAEGVVRVSRDLSVFDVAYAPNATNVVHRPVNPITPSTVASIATLAQGTRGGIASTSTQISPNGMLHVATRVAAFNELHADLYLRLYGAAGTVLLAEKAFRPQVRNPMEVSLSYVLGSQSGDDVVSARVEQDGPWRDSWIMYALSGFDESILWEFSPDSGTSWFPASSVRGLLHGALSFPVPGNALRWRVTAYRANSVIDSIRIRPWYSPKLGSAL